jgi:hypothetical protein
LPKGSTARVGWFEACGRRQGINAIPAVNPHGAFA